MKDEEIEECQKKTHKKEMDNPSFLWRPVLIFKPLCPLTSAEAAKTSLVLQPSNVHTTDNCMKKWSLKSESKYLCMLLLPHQPLPKKKNNP